MEPMSAPRTTITMLLVIAVFSQSLFPLAVRADNLFGKLRRMLGETNYHGTPPATGHDCAIETLAENIDWLEHYIDTYGSVVAKSPDIWGEARLTKHRDEYERILFREINQFKATLNASISQGDSAFLAQALALSNAASAGTVSAAEGNAEQVSIEVADAQLVSADDPSAGFQRFGIEPDATASDAKITLEPVAYLDQLSRYLKHLHQLRRINEGDDTSDSPGYSLNLVRIPVSILPGKMTRQGFGAEITITAEPVLSDDLMPTTFKNLAVNDVVDFLGLPLVRASEIPEDERDLALRAKKSKPQFENSIHKLQQQYALHKNDLNSLSFVNDVSPLLDEFFNNRLAVQTLLGVLKQYLDELEAKNTPALRNKQQVYAAAAEGNPSEQEVLVPERLSDMIAPISSPGLKAAIQRSVRQLPESYFRPAQTQILKDPTIATPNGGRSGLGTTNQPLFVITLQKLAVAIQTAQSDAAAEQLFRLGKIEDDSFGSQTRISQALTERAYDAVAGLDDLAKTLTGTAPPGRTRRALNPLNPTFLLPVLGVENVVQIADAFEPAYFGRSIRWNGGPRAEEDCDENRVDLLDARRFLRAELEAAYELLSQPEHVGLFAELASPCSGLAAEIRNGHLTAKRHPVSVEKYRHYFFQQLHQHAVAEQLLPMAHASADPMVVGVEGNFSPNLMDVPVDEAESSVEALAWAVVVESALLNERLNRDVRKLAEAKQVYELETNRDYSFFLPDTVMKAGPGLQSWQGEYQLATDIFQQYVRARWPIHVFAIDPVAQDQNVADVSQRKRELQFALALGFANGQIGANSLTQFARELETQIETISLNRTVVGFGHGEDTFGWRFYPRVQALDVPGTLGTIAETIRGTSRDYDLRHRRIEAGQRECVAVILMPSFVPYADFDVRANWFKLTNPKNSALTMKDSVKLSRAVTAMRNSRAQCAECQHLYRKGELERLFKRVDQLDRELPLQTERALVPYENTLGGFEMFNTGVTNLAPELYGWYGAPGVLVDCDASDASECNAEVSEKLTAIDSSLEEIQSTLQSGTSETNPAVPLPVCEGEGTTLFLVGDNFSVHDTKIIAGGRCISSARLISRDLMRVTIPKCVNTVTLCENGSSKDYVSVYVATPYGVTNHLHVPVAKSKAEKELEEQLKAEVKSQIDDLDIPPRVASVKPDGDRGDTVKIIATPLQEGGYKLDESTESATRIKFDRTDDPRFIDRDLKIWSAVRSKDQFITPLVYVTELKYVRPEETTREFRPLGEDDGRRLLRVLREKLEGAEFPADGSPLELKLVYYVVIEGQEVPVRLEEEVDLEISLRRATSNPQAGAATDSRSSEAFPVRRFVGQSDASSRARTFQLVAAKLGRTQQSGEGKPVTELSPRLAQRLDDQIGASVLTGDDNPLLRIRERLDRIESQFDADAIAEGGASAVTEAIEAQRASDEQDWLTTARPIEVNVSILNSTREHPPASAKHAKTIDAFERFKNGIRRHFRDVKANVPTL
jgi:hypothetical protein